MKKLGLIILGFIIGALLTYKFCPRVEEKNNEVEEITKPAGIISVEEAIVLNNNWTKYRKEAVDSAAARQGRKIDKRSTSWTLKEIRDYLDYAEAESKNMGYTMDGIQVYLGVYEENAGAEKSNYTTMFIAPTGNESLSKASMIPFNNNIFIGNPPVPPLNAGVGGGGYP